MMCFCPFTNKKKLGCSDSYSSLSPLQQRERAQSFVPKIQITLHCFYSNCDPWTNTVSKIYELARNAESGGLLQAYGIRIAFQQNLQWIPTYVKF